MLFCFKQNKLRKIEKTTFRFVYVIFVYISTLKIRWLVLRFIRYWWLKLSLRMNRHTYFFV